MKAYYLFRLLILSFLVNTQCTPSPSQSSKIENKLPQNLAEFLDRDLNYLFSVQQNNWKTEHQENKQTYQDYINSKPTSSTKKRNKIYLQTFGEFTKKEQQLIEITAEYLSTLDDLEVRILASQSLDSIPKHAQRINQYTNENQILSTYLLNTILLPQLPDRAAAYIGFTSNDLYPAQSWN